MTLNILSTGHSLLTIFIMIVKTIKLQKIKDKLHYYIKVLKNCLNSERSMCYTCFKGKGLKNNYLTANEETLSDIF